MAIYTDFYWMGNLSAPTGNATKKNAGSLSLSVDFTFQTQKLHPSFIQSMELNNNEIKTGIQNLKKQHKTQGP